jgi:hypothetical protein
MWIKSLSKYSQVRSCFQVFIVRNPMVRSDFTSDVWFVIYRFFSLKSYTHVITNEKVLTSSLMRKWNTHAEKEGPTQDHCGACKERTLACCMQRKKDLVETSFMGGLQRHDAILSLKWQPRAWSIKTTEETT